MIIKFKNKMTMALQKMIDDGTRLGGLPMHVEVSPNEAAEIFREIRTLTPPPVGYTITSKDGVNCSLMLRAKEISELEMASYVSNWKVGEWKVEFKKIKLIVVNPTAQTVQLHG